MSNRQMLNSIAAYRSAFSNLHVKVVGGRKFPTKTILLISRPLTRCLSSVIQ